MYPSALKDVIRARFPEELDTVPKPDPEGNTVCMHTCLGHIQYTYSDV